MEIAVLEQALRQQPDDLGRWREYSDRLDGQGDARGALIRLDLRRRGLRRTDREAVDREIEALVAEHEPAWDAALPAGVTVLDRRYGFATKVAVQWSEDAPVLIAQALRDPFVTALRITARESREDDEDDEHLEEVDAEPTPVAGIGALAALDLGRLVELDLSYLRLAALGAEALAVASYLHLGPTDDPATATAGRIETLDLRYCRIGDAGLAAIAASGCFGAVRRLHLQANRLTAAGASALGRFERLTELDLRYNPIGADGVRALLGTAFIGSVDRLLLYPGDVGDDGAKLLAHAAELPPALRSYWRCV